MKYFDGPTTTGGAYVQGGTVFININSGMSQATNKSIAAASLSHELTHFMQEYAPKEYEELKDYVVSSVLKKSPAEFDKLIQQQMRWQPGLTYDELVDEMVANACQTMLLDDRAVTKLARQNMSLAQKVADMLDEITTKIKAAFNGIDFAKDAGPFQAVRAVMDEMDGIAERWSDGIAAAVENYNAVQIVSGNKENKVEDAQFQRRDSTEVGTAAEQEITVRHERFSYEGLTRKPDMPVTVIDDSTEKYVRADVVKAGLRNVEQNGGKTVSGMRYVRVKDINSDVRVSRNGLTHGLDRRIVLIAPVVEHVGDILSNSVLVNELNPRDIERTQNTFVLVGMAKNKNNEPYIAVFVVNRATNELESMDVLYSVNAKSEHGNKKSAAGSWFSPSRGRIAPANFTASEISIADLLEYVNQYFPDVLPEDVLKHFGHQRRPEGKLGASWLMPGSRAKTPS